MPEGISDDELKTLLASVEGRAEDPSLAGATRTPIAYDFKRPQRINKDQSRLIENVHEQFARLFSSTLGSSMRMVVDVDLAFTDQVLYNEFILSLPSPCSAYSFTMDPPGGSAVLHFAPELLMAIIDRALGGKGESYEGDPRPLTPIETNIVNKLAGRMFQDLEAAWEVAVSLRISDIVLETNPEFIQIAGSGDPVLIVALEVNTSRASGLIHLCYPFPTLEPLLPKLSPASRRSKQTSETRRIRSRVLDKVQVPVVVEIARGSLPLKELAELRKGDIVKLDTSRDEPAVVFVGNRPKFLARPGLDGRKRAVKILDPIAEEEEELYL